VFCAADGKHIEVVCKPTFGSVELGELLERYSNESEEPVEVDFCGVCTGICVISNAMIAKAFIPEAKVCIIEKACACVTPQSHQTAIEAMKTCQIDII
jgi:amidase